MSTQIRNSEMTDIIQPDMFRAGLWSEVIAGFQALPGLVGFWPMSSIQRSTGNVYDLSGQGRTLTKNGTTAYGYSGLAPIYGFDGASGYLSRADETDLDIIGNEAAYNPGVTLGGWYNAARLDTAYLLGKGLDAYGIALEAAGTVLFRIGSGVSTYDVRTSVISINTWYFICARYIPSTSISIRLNEVSNSNSTAIPATINNNATALTIGNNISGWYWGSTSLCFLCANALSDSIINGLYQRSRLLFNV